MGRELNGQPSVNVASTAASVHLYFFRLSLLEPRDSLLVPDLTKFLAGASLLEKVRQEWQVR